MTTRLKDAAEVTSSVSPERAPRTFDPTNRNACPAVLDDRWQGEHARGE